MNSEDTDAEARKQKMQIHVDYTDPPSDQTLGEQWKRSLDIMKKIRAEEIKLLITFEYQHSSPEDRQISPTKSAYIMPNVSSFIFTKSKLLMHNLMKNFVYTIENCYYSTEK